MLVNKHCDQSQPYDQYGFTLIELLVVISIISLLSSTVLTAVSSVRNKARLAAGKRFEQSIRSSVSDCSVAFYNFESDNNNKVLEATGQSEFDGSIEGDPARVDSLGKLGQAMKFDGDDDRVDVPDKIIDTSQPITVAAWVTVEDTDGHRFFFGNNEISFQLGIDSGVDEFELEAETSQGGQVRLSGPSFDTNRWHYVAGVYDKADSKARFYVDGGLVGTADLSGNLNSGNTLIGAKFSSGSVPPWGGASWSGKIDNLRVYHCPFESAGT